MRGSREQEIRFRIAYHVTSPEEQLFWRSGSEVAMSQVEPGIWEHSIFVSLGEILELEYNFLVRKGGDIYRVEPLVPHVLRVKVPEKVGGMLLVEDRWLEPSPLHRLTKSPLAKLLGYPELSKLPIPMVSLSDDASALLLFERQELWEGELFIIGSSAELGQWNPQEARVLVPTRSGYSFTLQGTEEVEYKLLLKDEQGEIHWEEGANRRFSPNPYAFFAVVREKAPWFSVPVKSADQITGTAVPLFSLRSEKSYGVGDFSDAIRLLEWLERRGQKVLQLLPFYDTTFSYTKHDSYPYNSVTTYGLHPLYMDVRKLPFYEEHLKREDWERRARELNDLPSVAYSAVMELKLEVMDACFERWFASELPNEFEEFVKNEGEALLSYALFCTYRDESQGTPVAEYPPYDYAKRHWRKSKRRRKEVARHAFRQFFLYQQLSELSSSARARGILLKGDLPIGVGRNSADVWQAPHLFHLDMIAGAPPDAFSATGQAWGFPTYNWDAMNEEGYTWWRSRLSGMGKYLDAIRIDHILGFFRIWSIPYDSGKPIDGYYVPAIGYPAELVQGVEDFFSKDDQGNFHPQLTPERSEGFSQLDTEEQGHVLRLRDDYYYHRNESLWRNTALERLTKVMSASEMLICAEDLGMLPSSIQEVLSSLELFTLEVIRMPKKAGSRFILPSDIPLLSVLCTSTHDMPTLRGWWRELSEGERVELAKLYGFEDEPTPAGLVRALTNTTSLLLILPLQDWFVLDGYGQEVPPVEEQINVPDDPHHIWDYRMPGTIENL